MGLEDHLAVGGEWYLVKADAHVKIAEHLGALQLVPGFLVRGHVIPGVLGPLVVGPGIDVHPDALLGRLL